MGLYHQVHVGVVFYMLLYYLCLYDIGWMNEVRNETLSVYKVDFSDSGPNLILRKMICLVSEGIWHFSY